MRILPVWKVALMVWTNVAVTRILLEGSAAGIEYSQAGSSKRWQLHAK